MIASITAIRSVFKKTKTFAGSFNFATYFSIIAVMAVLGGLYISSFYDYLLFHSSAEIFSAIIGASIFVIAWNSRDFSTNNYVLFLGFSFLPIALISILHAFAYKGMGVFSQTGSNLATQLWIASRFMLAGAFLVAPFFLGKKFRAGRIIFLMWAIAGAFILSIFYFKIFPTAYVEGVGPTPFKEVSEYVISAILLIALVILSTKRKSFDQKVFYSLAASIIFSILSEISFTLYVGVYSFFNMLGHLLMIASFYFMYRAITVVGIKKPYNLIFKSLKEDEEMLNSFLSYPKDSLIILNADGKILNVKKSFLWGGNESIQSVIGKSFYSFFSSEVAKIRREQVAMAIKTKLPIFYMDELDQTYFENSIYPVITEQNDHRIEKIAIFSRDITRRRVAEDALAKISRQYAVVLESAGEGIIELDPRGDVIFINPAASKMLGLHDQDELIGRSLHNLVHVDEVGTPYPLSKCPIVHVFAEKKVKFVDDDYFRTKQGVLLPVDYVCTPIMEGELATGLVVTFRDATERRHHEAILKLHGKRMETLSQDLRKFQWAVAKASDHIVITDAEGMVIYANKAVENITGYSRKEVIGKKAGALWGGQMTKEFYEHFWKVIKEDKEVFIGEVVNKRNNGEKYYAEVKVSPILDYQNDKKVIFFVGIERDITVEKEAIQTKNEFISFASHQLRTPLTSLGLSAEMLLKGVAGDLNKEQKKYLKMISHSGREMIDLIEALLNITRIEMGALVASLEKVSLAKLLSAILKDFQMDLKARKLHLTVDSDKNLPLVDADHRLLHMIIENLISNAIKYTSSEGNILVELKKQKSDVVVSVSDTGEGIDEEQQIKIFEKTYRVDQKQKAKIKGSGLGLYIVKLAVEQSGGRVWVQSPSLRAFGNRKPTKKQKGTTFFVSVPLTGMKRLSDKSTS